MARRPSAKKDPVNPVTPEDEKKFDFFMDKWRKLLNLSDWRYVKLAKKSTSMAEITEQITKHRLVRWKVGTDFGETPVTPATLEKTAIHENLHVLLHTLVEAAIEDKEYSDRVVAEEHRVIAVLESQLLKVANLT